MQLITSTFKLILHNSQASYSLTIKSQPTDSTWGHLFLSKVPLSLALFLQVLYSSRIRPFTLGTSTTRSSHQVSHPSESYSSQLGLPVHFSWPPIIVLSLHWSIELKISLYHLFSSVGEVIEIILRENQSSNKLRG